MAQLLAKKQHQPDYPVLPKGMQRNNVDRLLRRTKTLLGLSSGELGLLCTLIDETAPSDWTSNMTEPVCFAKQKNIARITGMTERSVRRIEGQLERRGLVRKDTGINGQRCRLKHCDGSYFKQGINLSPLIEKIPDLLALEAQINDRRKDEAIISRKIGAAKRMVRELIMDLQSRNPSSTTLPKLTDEFLSWPTRYDASMVFETLQEHLTEVLNLHSRLSRFSASRATDSKVETLQTGNEEVIEMSGSPDSSDRQYIQDTNQETYVICNENDPRRTDCKQSGPSISTITPNISVECVEKSKFDPHRARNSKFLADLSPMRLFYLSSLEMQSHIALYQGEAPTPTPTHFVLASLDRAYELTISKHAIDIAADQMGDFTTALCLMIIDRNMKHPKRPIASPGGVLRAMTARHAQGKLYIERSLIGLSQRNQTIR